MINKKDELILLEKFIIIRRHLGLEHKNQFHLIYNPYSDEIFPVYIGTFNSEKSAEEYRDSVLVKEFGFDSTRFIIADSLEKTMNDVIIDDKIIKGDSNGLC